MKRCSRWAVLGAMAFTLVVPICALAQASRFPAHFTPAPLPIEIRDAFFDAFTGDRPLKSGIAELESEGTDPLIRDVWVGNQPKLSSSIDHIEITFEAPPETPDGTNEIFVLYVSFKMRNQFDTVVVRTTRPLVRGLESGVQMFLATDTPRRALVRGQGETSFVVALPETHDKGTRGLLICPIALSSSPKKLGTPGSHIPGLSASGFHPVSARLVAEASVRGRLGSGLQPSIARANIATSDGIPNEKLHFDETFSRDPRVDVTFQDDELTASIPFLPDGKFIQGLLLQLELQNHAGYVRSTTLRETLEISPVDRDFEFTVRAQRREFNINSRSCWILLKSSRLVNEYSKVDSKS